MSVAHMKGGTGHDLCRLSPPGCRFQTPQILCPQQSGRLAGPWSLSSLPNNRYCAEGLPANGFLSVCVARHIPFGCHN